MWKRVLVTVAVVAFGAGPFFSSEAQTPAVGESERAFMVKAAEGGAAEVDLGRLATARAANEAVRRFGARMVADHGTANAQLQALATMKGVELPRDVSTQHRATQDRLGALTGGDFDRAYMHQMVSDHDRTVAEFERASESLQDRELRTWIKGTLPTLREHQRLARELDSTAALAAAPATLVVPSALPVAVVAGPGALVKWCQGAWNQGQGSNFGVCSR